MKHSDKWLLPEGIAEVLPPQAHQLDYISRQLLDLFYSWGYDLVIPPLIEYLESLLNGSATDLELQTFKLTDQLTGRMMGVRADMTPQVARIDAHHLQHETIARLCYLGTILHTRSQGFASSRSPMQLGVELYGDKSIDSDVEVIQLMMTTLDSIGIRSPCLDLGHVGVYRGLVVQAGLTHHQEAELFDVLARKSKPELAILLDHWSLDKTMVELFIQLIDLNGGEELIANAKSILANAHDLVLESLENYQKIANRLTQLIPNLNIHYDLAELRGYHYHTGVVFSAFVMGQGQAIAWGGRYDNIAEVFGRARPATGFSTDLKYLMALIPVPNDKQHAIMAPYAPEDSDLAAIIGELRVTGERVISLLPNQVAEPRSMACDRILKQQSGQWRVCKVN